LLRLQNQKVPVSHLKEKGRRERCRCIQGSFAGETSTVDTDLSKKINEGKAFKRPRENMRWIQHGIENSKKSQS